MILFIWAIYPVVGTVVIIVLAYLNRKYKRRIWELEAEKRVMKTGEVQPSDGQMNGNILRPEQGQMNQGQLSQGQMNQGQLSQAQPVQPRFYQSRAYEYQSEQPQTKKFQPDWSHSEQSSLKQPNPEQPNPEQPSLKQPNPEQPNPEQPISEQPNPEQLNPEQPISEQLNPEQPISEQPNLEQSALEQPNPQQPNPQQAPAPLSQDQLNRNQSNSDLQSLERSNPSQPYSRQSNPAQPSYFTKARPAQTRKPVSVYPGTAALVIGVVFVILAGLIFATTAWKILPDIFKAVMVFAFSILFFTSSCIAGKKLKIERTSRAFYILGSIFLFLTVLAVGYFKLLGPGFVLEGQNRWWVLWCGSVVTEAAFLTGFKNYKEKVYAYVYLLGLTVSMTFLMAALRKDGVGFAEGMVCYSFLLLLCDWLNGNRKKQGGKGFLPEQTEGIWSYFSIIHFLVFSALLMPGTLLGFPAQDVGIFLVEYRITIWKIFCLAIATVGMRVALARWNGQKVFSILYSLLLSLFSLYVVWSLPLCVEFRFMAAVILQGVWFTVNWQEFNPLKVRGEVEISTAVLLMNTLVLIQDALWGYRSLESYLSVTVAFLVLAAVALQWKSRNRIAWRSFPYLLCGLTASVCGIIGEMGSVDVRWDLALFSCLALIAVWDFRKKDCFCPDILLLGTGLQFYTQIENERAVPFFLVLSVYLFLKSWEMEGSQRKLMRKGSSLYSLAGLYLELYGRLPNRLLEILAVFGLLVLEYAAAVLKDKEQRKDWYWDIAGSVVFIALMLQYYQNDLTGAIWPVICLAVFLVVYCKIYSGRCHGAGLPVALMVLPLPWNLMMRAEFSENLIYLSTMIFLLLSGIILRLLGPVYRQSEQDGKIEKVDWFQMAAGAVLVVMAYFGSREWRFLYTLLLIPYLMQYNVFTGIRKWIRTAMMAVAVTAWWIQPLFQIPDRIWLEMQLLPLVLFAAGLPVIWGKERYVRNIQTGIGIFCLASMAVAAVLEGDVWDALILEGVCLLVFLAAYLIKSRRWVKISGTVIVLAALYMTKGFWLSLSWWIYLLAAGVGLIGFAAWYEAKNREK